MKAVVTGGLGFIGSHFVQFLRRKGWRVLVVDKITSVSHDFWEGDPDFVRCDICDLKELPDCDFVFNFAAESHVANSIVKSDDFMHSNILGVHNLLELVRHKQGNVRPRPVFVQISTDEVYGSIAEGSFTEECLLNPSNPYSASKASADQLVMAWNTTYGVEYNIIRPTNNWGPGQYPEKLVPLTVRLLEEGKKIRLHDGGLPKRSWLHVQDTCQAIYAVATEGKRNEIYNISGQTRENREIVRRVISAYNSLASKSIKFEDVVDLGYKREGQDMRYSVEDSKIVSHTSWRRTHFVEEPELWESVVATARRDTRW